MRKFLYFDREGSIVDDPSPCLCSFGILESIAAFTTTTLASIGVGSETAGIIGTAASDALAGGAIGAITDPRNPLKGAEFGAISGAAAGLAEPALADLGLGGVVGGGLSGAIGGALGGAATGRNIVKSALLGGAGGALATAAGVGSPSTSTGGLAASAAGSAAPASVPAAAVPADVPLTGDLTGATAPITAVQSNALPDLSSAVTAAAPTPASGNFSLINNDFGGGAPAAAPVLAPDVATPATAAAATNAPAPAAAAAPAGSTITATPGAPQPMGIADAVSGGDSSGGLSAWLDQNRWAPGAAFMALDVLKGNQALPGQKALQADAANLSRQGNLLQSYLRSGTLPPGLSIGIKEAAEAAKATIRSQYAATGGDSSAMAQDLAAVDQHAATQGAQIAVQLLQQGVSETEMADQLYLKLMGVALQQDQELGQAFTTFASGLVPATSTVKAAA